MPGRIGCECCESSAQSAQADAQLVERFSVSPLAQQVGVATYLSQTGTHDQGEGVRAGRVAPYVHSFAVLSCRSFLRDQPITALSLALE